MNNTECCPHCRVSLVAGPIPESNREKYYGGKTHFSRKIGIVEHDRVVAWKCPDCGKEWSCAAN